MIGEEEYDLRCAASDIVWEKCEKSTLFDEKAEAQVPRFHPHEIEHGIFLGSGGFCTVTELMDVVLLSPSSETTSSSSRMSIVLATKNKNNNAISSTTSAAASSTDGSSSSGETIHNNNTNAASHITTTTKGRDRDNNKNKNQNQNKKVSLDRKSEHLPPRPVDNSTTTSPGTNNTTTTDSTSSSPYSSSSFGVRSSTSHHHQHSIIVQDRSFIAQYHQRDGHARYAIKMLSKSTLAGRRNNNEKSPDHKRFIAGVVDLALEVKYLSIIQHPHIIKMRGIAKTHPCSDSFFIILDRLYDTLSDRMKGWKKLQKRMSGLGTIRDLKGAKKEQALGERLVVAYNICSALQFLHQNNIIYRDLKPDNIGFDVRDDVKIFDFGLAAEMHPSLRIEGTNTYNLTAESGSPRYMAPEVALGQPYNQMADVYSFSILLWEMCTMKTPFSGYDFETLHKKVFKGSHRPELNSKWNKPLREVMEKCWRRRTSDRLECDEIMNTLREEIVTVYGGDGTILDCMNVSSKTEASVVRRAAIR